MLGKTDEQRVTSLLTEAITMLCRNGLSYQHELCVEGLLGITLDKQSVVLVNIKETINLEPDSDDTPQEGAAVAETPLTPTRAFKSPRRTPDSCRPMRPAKRRRSNTSSSSTGVLPDDTAMVTPVQSPLYDSVTGSSVVILDQEETPFDVDAAEIKTEIVEKVECSDYPSLSSGDGYVNQINSGRNRLTETLQYGGHVQSDATTMDDSAATWDFATNSMPTTANTFTGYNESCVTQDVTELHQRATCHDAASQKKPTKMVVSLRTIDAGQAVVETPPSLQSWQSSLSGNQRKQHHNITNTLNYAANVISAAGLNMTQSLSSANSDTNNVSVQHSCSFCGKRLSCLHTLKLHEQRHRGVYPYHCPYCGKGFANRYNLSGHLVRHTNVREHKCKQCGLEFAYRLSLKRHVEKVHGGGGGDDDRNVGTTDQSATYV